jgi:hypothetical protein
MNITDLSYVNHGVTKAEMEFLDIILTKDSNLLFYSMLFTVFLLVDFLKKTDSTLVFKIHKKNLRNKKTQVYS